MAIDSEGQNYEGTDVVHRGVAYSKHGTFLWGASGMERTGAPTPVKPHGVFRDLPLTWLCHGDKRALGFVEIVEWLLSLPEIYGDAVFISFGFNYDVTMILQALAEYMPGRAYQKVYEICKKERLGSKGKIRVKGHVYVGDYTIDWIKGKRLVIKKFRNREADVYDANGRPIKDAFIKRIVIYDVFGFYQSDFVKVIKSLATIGLAAKEEVETIARDKERREAFHQVPLDEIKAYTYHPSIF